MAENDSTMDEADNSPAKEEEDDDDNDNYGNTMEQIYRNLGAWGQKNFPKVAHTQNHTVLFHLPFKNNEGDSCPPRPYDGHLKWDAHHVRLPCSTKNQYPVTVTNGTTEEEVIRDRWSLICDAFDDDILNIDQLEKAILSYNSKYSKIWKFHGLYRLFRDDNELPDEVRKQFFAHTLPGIIRLALRLPELIPNAIPLLKSGTNRSVSFTQQQISSLLANAFLCTFPRRNTQKRNSEYRSFPDINFNRLFSSTDSSVLEKIKCILNYFRRVCANVPTGVITVIRRCISQQQLPKWSQLSNTNFLDTMLHATTDGTIENDGLGLLQVDFANKYLGGGVLGRGCVQEEIRFVICPELFITKLIVEVLQPNEAIFIVGCERFSDYTGYSTTFEFDNNFFDETPKDESKRRLCSIVAIDALHIFKINEQFREELLLRELNKAYVGYQPWLDRGIIEPPAVASGNWGCGAFGGNKQLKALLQLIVCAYTGRPLVYYTFGDKEFKNEFLNIFYFLKNQKITIAELFKYLKQFSHEKLPGEQLYPFIYQFHQDHISSKMKNMKAKDVTNTSKVEHFLPPSTSANDSKIDGTGSSIASSSMHLTWPHERKTKSPTIFNSQSPIKKSVQNVSSTNTTSKQARTSLFNSLDSSYFQSELRLSRSSITATATTSGVQPASSSASRQIIETKEINRSEMVMASDDVDMCEKGQYINIGSSSTVQDVTTKQLQMIRKTINETHHNDDDDDGSEIDVIPGTPPSASTSTIIRAGGGVGDAAGSIEKKTSLHSRQKKISDFLFRK